MATARGANTKLLAIQEVTYGTAPGGNWTQYPFIPPLDLGGAQQLLESPVIGVSPGRDPSDPFYDAVTVDGTVNIPLDLTLVGFWMKMLFGLPATTGSAPNYTHTFKSDSATIPFFSVEVGYPDVPSYVRLAGCKAGQLSVSAQPTDRPQASVTLLGKSASRHATSGGGTAVLPTGYEQFNNFQASLTRNGSALGYVTGVTFTYNNNLEPVRDIGSGNDIREALEQDSQITGTLNLRLSETTLLSDSEGTTPLELALTWQISATKSIAFRMPRVFLPRRKAQVQGRSGVDVTFDLRGSYDTTALCAMEVVLKNQTATY
jgi:hypothetical protein